MRALAIGGGVWAAKERRAARVLVIGSRQRGATLPDPGSLRCEVIQVASGGAALNAVRHERCELALFYPAAIADKGLDLVSGLLAERPDLSVVVVTPDANLDAAIEAMRVGARDYMPAPITPARVRELLAETHGESEVPAVEQALTVVVGGAAPLGAFPTPAAPQPPTLGGDFSLAEVEREHIRRVIARSRTLRDAARTLSVDPSSLYRWRKKGLVEASAGPLLPLAPKGSDRDAKNS